MIRRMLAPGAGGDSSLTAVLAPMADVVFLLIVFLLLGQARLFEGQIRIAAGPGGPSVEPAPTAYVAVRRGSGGLEYRVNDQPWGGSETLRAALGLARSAGLRRVLVDPGDGVSLAEAMTVFEEAEPLGLTDLAMLSPDP